jgi:glycosyltransferase involved in cell wall biosynthesis
MRHSGHDITLLTLPARKWKWRMRGAAIWFAQEIKGRSEVDFDLILANDMVSVTDLRGLLPRSLRDVPIVSYFHENQLTYPLAPDDVRDYQYGFTNITTCLASDEVWFNSESHGAAFLEAAGALLRSMPDHVPAGVIEQIAARSRVVWPPVQGPPVGAGMAGAGSGRAVAVGEGPRIVWNHRWEYDKNPGPFFEALCVLDTEGVDFRVAILGESFRRVPGEFERLQARLGHRIDHCGYAASGADYWGWLAASDVVVSTAIQENFGLSIVEAILAGCFPILPNRLSYPELIPPGLHRAHLYESDEELVARLKVCLESEAARHVEAALVEHLWSRCGAHECIFMYDKHLRRVAALGQPGTAVTDS